MASRCMVCGKTTETAGLLHRVSDYQRPAVWTCGAHASKALRMYAEAHGADNVRPDLRQYVDPGKRR